MKRAKEFTRRFLRDHGLVFRNEDLLSTALTHPSYAQEKNSIVNNQRLEFLGDGVLNLLVAEYLYNNYQTKAEGELTKIRARVVCEKALLGVADGINMGEYLLLGRGEEMSGGRKRKSILADAVESIIGAIYLDQGIDAARGFVLKHLEKEIIEAAQGDFYDYKSRLQEMVQGKTKEKVLFLPIRGAITNNPDENLLRTKPGMVQEIVSQLEKAEKDPRIKALLLGIESPGGSSTDSDILFHELERYKSKTGVKVVAIMMGIAASGGYYAALASDRIVAHPSTITGSVGTIFLRPKVQGLMEKIGVGMIFSYWPRVMACLKPSHVRG